MPTPLTPAQMPVFRILFNADEPLWALAVARSTGIPYGTVYQTFRVLYDLGWVVGVTETANTGRPARVLYRLTKQGREQASALLNTPDKE